MKTVSSIALLALAMTTMTHATPLLVANSKIWGKETRFYFANCQVTPASGVAVQPKSKWTKHSLLLDLCYVSGAKYKTAISRLFGLATHGKTEKGTLYQFTEKGEEKVYFVFPFPVESGHLVVSNVYYKGAWHTILLVAVNSVDTMTSLVLVFDITDSNTALVPEKHYTQTDLKGLLAKPLIIKTITHDFGFVVGGNFSTTSELRLVPFENPQSITKWRFTKPLVYITGIDSTGRGVVDRLYIADKETLFALDFSQGASRLPYKLSTASLATEPLVLWDEKREALQLFFLSTTANGPGIYSVFDPLTIPKNLSPPQLALKGQWATFLIRSGHIIAIPSSVTHFKTALLWDPENQKEVLVTWNDSCQLNFIKATLTQDKYGRIAYRKTLLGQ